MLYAILTTLLFALSFLAGMLGLGVAFIATPVLGLFGYELKHVIMPWSLMLNGLTAIAGAVTFARARMVDWRTAVPLLIITTLAAPAGVWLLQFVPTDVVWWIYVGVLFFLAYRMAFPPKMDDSQAPVITDGTRVKGGLLSAGIGVFADRVGAVRHLAVVFGFCHPPGRRAVRLADAGPDFRQRRDRRLAGRALHGQAGEVAHPQPRLRRRAGAAGRAAHFHPADGVTAMAGLGVSLFVPLLKDRLSAPGSGAPPTLCCRSSRSI